MPDLQEIPSLDTEISPEMNSWNSLPSGFRLLIEEGPDYFLLVDDTHRLLIE